MAQVHLRGVKKTYDNKVAVIHGIDMEIADGEFIVIVGPSGCGKSTLLRMVAGLERITGGQVAINANEARLQGVEIELSARPLESLELTAAYGYTDAEFTDFDGTGVFDGNRLPNTPLYTFNAAARYEYPLDNGLGIVSRVDYNRTGTIYFADENVGYQPTYDTVDAQIGLEADRWSVTLWGRNVLDERYASSVYMRSISPAIYGRLDIDAMQNEPGATYGAEFRWRF